MSSSSASTSNGSNVEHFEEGKFIQVTYQGITVTGLVWSHASAEGLLVMQIIAQNGDVDVVIIQTSEITNVVPAATESVPKRCTVLAKVDTVDVTLARKSEEKKVAQEKVKAEGINTSVSRAAQDLYNRLMHLNISCSWDQHDIVIPGSFIRIQPPYGPENCTLTGDASFKTALERVQRIVAKK